MFLVKVDACNIFRQILTDIDKGKQIKIVQNENILQKLTWINIILKKKFGRYSKEKNYYFELNGRFSIIITLLQ